MIRFEEELEKTTAIDEEVILSKGQDRFLELIQREQLPGDVRTTLAGALTGDLRAQQLLFQAMLDTWPRLQKNLAEVEREVLNAPWDLEPSDADDAASKLRANFVGEAIHGLKPRAAWGELALNGIKKQLVFGYFAGQSVTEILWDQTPQGTLPRAGRPLPPRFFGFPDSVEGGDRLMLNRDGGFSSNAYEDFPEHHFLLGLNSGHPGHPAIAAPLRALTGYWLAATYGLKWLLNFAQLYGIPFRWAEYSDDSVKGKVCDMLSTIGSSGWGAFPQGTKINFVDASKSANALPQKDLVEMADVQCDTFILGQTLTTSEGSSGSRALGEVHQQVRQGVLKGVADYVADALNSQLIPSIITLNYPDADHLPTYRARFEEPKDEEAMARRDTILVTQLGMQIDQDWLHERHRVPKAAAGSPATRIESSNQAEELTLDALVDSTLEGLTGVTKDWLSSVRPYFERLGALALSDSVTNEDLADALQQAQTELPELFDQLNTEALQQSLDEAMKASTLLATTANAQS